MVMSDGSLAITDGDNASVLSVTNATVTTGNMVVLTADAATSGSILYIDNGGGTLDGGYYINCNDDGTADFTVGVDGATKITTADAATKALHVVGVQTSEDMVTFDNTGGVIASDSAVLLIDAGGAVASGGNLLRVAPTGSPNAGAIGIEYVGASKAMTAMYIDGDPTASDLVTINGGGALTNDNAVLVVSSDGALATGGNTFRVETTGTPASGAIYAEYDSAGVTDTNENIGVKIDAGGKKVIGLHVDADPEANSAVYFTSGAALAADKGTLEVVSNVAACNADSQVIRAQQASATGANVVLGLLQADVSEPFILFESTEGSGSSVDETNSTEGTAIGFLRISVNGTDRYLSYFGTPS
jgi:hypothetical protein